MARIIALLDVDDTLYFGYHPPPLDKKRINLDLLLALKERKITELYLFTDMVMEDRVIAHRQLLIEFLRSQGFAVHGVITPNDLLWGNYLIYKDSAIRNKNSSVFVRNSFKKNQPGIAFDEAVREIANKKSLSTATRNKSVWITRVLIPYFYKKMDCKQAKGLMLEHFLFFLPAKVKKVVLIDDRRSVLDSIRQFMQMAHLYQFDIPEIDLIHVSKKNRGSYYTHPLATQATGIAAADFSISIIVHTIEREIQRLSTNILCFNMGHSEKAAASLINLKTLIQCELDEHQETMPTYKQSRSLFHSLKQANTFHPNFLAYLDDFYTYGATVLPKNPLLQRGDVQLILKEISRLRHDTLQYFFSGKKLKADLIENALMHALRQGAEDVTQDDEVQRALQYHRIFGFFGHKDAAALVNVEQARSANFNY